MLNLKCVESCQFIFVQCQRNVLIYLDCRQDDAVKGPTHLAGDRICNQPGKVNWIWKDLLVVTSLTSPQKHEAESHRVPCVSMMRMSRNIRDIYSHLSICLANTYSDTVCGHTFLQIVSNVK